LIRVDTNQFREHASLLLSVFEDRHGAILFVATTVILPLSLLRDMGLLTHSSIISVLADVIIAGVVVFSSVHDDKSNSSAVHALNTNETWAHDDAVVFMSAAAAPELLQLGGGVPPMDWTLAKWDTALEGLGPICLALVCQHTAFNVKNSLRDPTPRRFAFVAWLSLGLCLLLCLAIALGGFVKFSNNVSDPSV
jgi:amino acid permease